MKNTTKLTNGFKQKWTSALRSKRYLQNDGTEFYDSKTGRYSALGLAYKVSGVSENYLMANPTKLNSNPPFVPKELVSDETLIKKIQSFERKDLSFKWIASYVDRYL